MKFYFLLFLFVVLLLIPNVSASVVISEVFYDAAGSDTGLEFVELYNPTGQDMNISGWKLETGNGNDGVWSLYKLLNGSILAYGFYLIGGDNVSGVDIITNKIVQNGPDAVRLKDNSDVVIDTVGYGNLTYPDLYEGTPMFEVQEGHSIERRPGLDDPFGGNGQDTNNNSADFLDRTSPEPQNSSFIEIPFITVNLSREITPLQDAYVPNTTVNVSIMYSFIEPQIGLIIKETNPVSINNSNPIPDYKNQSSGLSKWLLKNSASIPNGSISYSFVTPSTPGNYTITGDWMSVNVNGSFSFGNVGDIILNVLSGALMGFVEDVFGNPLNNATVLLENSSTTADNNGFYSLPIPDVGEHALNASKTGYVTESVLVNISQLEGLAFNFTGNSSLVPEQVSDTEMLTTVFRWVSDYFDDDKILEVIHQWASTPE